MRKVIAVLMSMAFVFSYAGVCNALEINDSNVFSLIEYCENNEISSEEQLDEIIYQYTGFYGTTDIQKNDQDSVVSFELTIDYENQYVITTTVYESNSNRSTKSGHADKVYHNDLGYEVFTVRVDGSFQYNGSTCSTTSATATFTPALLSSWSSSPSASSGKSGNKAYAKASGTATNGFASQYYYVYLYCDINGKLTSA